METQEKTLAQKREEKKQLLASGEMQPENLLEQVAPRYAEPALGKVTLLPPDHQLEGKQIWHRLEGEPARYYQYFKLFLKQGDNGKGKRTNARVAKQLHKAESTIHAVCARFNWLARAEAYDIYWLEREDEARKLAVDETEKKWAARRDQQREDEYEIAQAFLEKVREMLRVPTMRQTITEMLDDIDSDGRIIVKQIIVNEPLDWSATDMVRFFEIAGKMARLASGMDTDRKKIRIDVSNMSDEDLERLVSEG